MTRSPTSETPTTRRWSRLLGVGVAGVVWERRQQAQLLLEDGTTVFAKAMDPGPEDSDGVDVEARGSDLGNAGSDPAVGRCQAAEVAGLHWLAEADATPVAEVVVDGPGALATRWIEPGQGDPAEAEEFGRQLAKLHQAGAATFGAPWPGCIGPLAQSNRPTADWVTFYGQQRLVPAARAAADAGALSVMAQRSLDQVIDALEDLGGPPEAPSRIHGDLWSGNVVWDRGGAAWLVDPAAQGGHRETDLAMLALFGVRHLERIMGAYREAYPLAQGWRRRVGLHQLHPLLVHAVLFGSSYGRRVADISDELLGRG